jgi:hypothetical protein
MLKRLLKTITRPIALGVMGLALMATTSNAQSLSSVYTSYVSSGSYTPITGGLSLGTTSSDDQMYFDSAAAALSGSTTLTLKELFTTDLE